MHAFGRAIPYLRRRRVLLTLVTLVCVHIPPGHREAWAYRETTLPTTELRFAIKPEPNFASSQQKTQQSARPAKDRDRPSTSVKASEHLESAAERWILAQVNAWEAANLKEHFPDEADRVVDAIFIRKLLLGGYQQITVHPYVFTSQMQKSSALLT